MTEKLDRLRELTIGRKRTPTRKILRFKAQEYEIRSPTVGERNKIQQKATSEDGRFNEQKFIVAAIIELTYVPKTEEKVFSDADWDVMMNCDVGSYVDVFAPDILEICFVHFDQKKSN